LFLFLEFFLVLEKSVKDLTLIVFVDGLLEEGKFLFFVVGWERVWDEFLEFYEEVVVGNDVTVAAYGRSL
jgi:hypothetical protein